MVNYRRNYNKGGIYFFTLALKDRKSNLLIKEAEVLYECIDRVKQAMPYRIIAQVVLPDHLHLLWKLPLTDADYSSRIRSIKGCFTKRLLRKGYMFSRNHKGECDLWQRRYWEHTIQNEEDLGNHIEYIHYNPVKHGLVKNPADWLYSTYHDYMRKGLIKENVSKNRINDLKTSFGE